MLEATVALTTRGTRCKRSIPANPILHKLVDHQRTLTDVWAAQVLEAVLDTETRSNVPSSMRRVR